MSDARRRALKALQDPDLAEAQRADDTARREVGLGRAGAMIGAAIAGTEVDPAWDKLAEERSTKVRDYMTRKKEAEGEAERLAKEDRTRLDSDTNKRWRAAVAKALPNYTEEDLAHFTIEDQPLLFKGAEFKSEKERRAAEAAQRAADLARRDAERKDDRARQERQAALDRALQREKAAGGGGHGGGHGGSAMDDFLRARTTKLLRDMEEDPKRTEVQGFEKVDGTVPTNDDAKKMKDSLRSAEKIRRYTADLRRMHKDNGTEFMGANAEQMAQLVEAIRLEAKNIGDLGALSGPDMGIVTRLMGSDPTSLGSNLKAMVGMDNTQAALDQMDKWVDDTLGATAKSYGYRPAGQARQPAPADVGEPLAQAGTVRVSNGAETLEIPLEDLADAEADGYRRLP